jgi:hypothetical protein
MDKCNGPFDVALIGEQSSRGAQASYGPQFILGMPRTWELQTRFRF